MIFTRARFSILSALCLLVISFSAFAQPTLPDLIGDEDNGLVLLSWTCQYDGVKSIAVLRSADSSFNYSTIGYVKKLYKGVQAFADGHPMGGKNYYKLSIVFNSGLTWGSNHVGVYVDSIAIRKSRMLPSNEALQKMIVTEGPKETPKPPAKKGAIQNAVAPADKDKYMEVYKKETPVAVADTTPLPPKPQYKVKHDEEDILADNYIESLPEEVKKKISITYADDSEEVDADNYIETEKKPAEVKKTVNMTFDDKADAAAFVATIPQAEKKKFTISYNIDTALPDAKNYIDEPKKPTADPIKKVTLKDEQAMQQYIETLPKNAKSKITISYSIDSATANSKQIKEEIKAQVDPPRPKISIKFSDDMNANAAADVKSRYIFNDAISGNVTMSLPEDIATHHYSVKFFDSENRAVIEIPKLNTAKIILDKRNFQKKGMYRFVLRRDVVELEAGYVNIY